MTLDLDGSDGTLEVENDSEHDLDPPGLYVEDAVDGHEIDGEVVDSAPVAAGEQRDVRREARRHHGRRHRAARPAVRRRQLRRVRPDRLAERFLGSADRLRLARRDAREDEQRVREPVQVAERVLVHHGTGLAELDHAPFGAADRAAREVEEGRDGVRAGDDEGVRQGMGQRRARRSATPAARPSRGRPGTRRVRAWLARPGWSRGPRRPRTAPAAAPGARPRARGRPRAPSRARAPRPPRRACRTPRARDRPWRPGPRRGARSCRRHRSWCRCAACWLG